MQSKFFTLAISALVLGSAIVLGQPQPTPLPKVGYVRFWNMLPPPNGAFEVGKLGSPAPDPPLLTAAAYRYSSYTELPAGRYQLAVLSRNNPQSAIKTFDVDLKPNTYFTILVSPQNRINAEMTEDTLDPKASSGTLIIRNFFPGTNISVSTGAKPIVSNLVYGQSITVSLPFDRTTLVVHTKLPDGKEAQAGADLDFKASSRATLLVIPDSYGRFRARVTFDGKNV